MARPERFELPTPRFVVWCSIQLSYGRLGTLSVTQKGKSIRAMSPKDRPCRLKSIQPVSVGTMAVSVTYQVRPFSIRMTLRWGAFAFAKRCMNSTTLGLRQASG
jgi:hypothetical protein